MELWKFETLHILPLLVSCLPNPVALNYEIKNYLLGHIYTILGMEDNEAHNKIMKNIVESVKEYNEYEEIVIRVTRIKIKNESNGQRIFIWSDNIMSTNMVGALCMNLSMAWMDVICDADECRTEFFLPSVNATK